MPVKISHQRALAVIGGRAFVNGSDYRELVERFRTGNLSELASDEVFRNIIFADEAELDHAALRITRAAQEFREVEPPEISGIKSERTDVTSGPLKEETELESDNQIKTSKAKSESRRAPLADSIRNFAEHIDASDPAQTYQSILAESADLLKAERGSLLLFDEAANHLTMSAARGIPTPLSEVGPVHLGEGIAG